MSNTRLVASPLWSMPASSSRVRKVFPVPDLPNTPLLRFTSSRMSRQRRVSMSNGLPIQKWRSSSAPNTVSMSSCDAVDAAAKWDGTVFAGS